MDEKKLLPCPFCGSPAEEYPDGDMEGFAIMCSAFHGIEMAAPGERCPMGTFGYATREEAIEAWNRRATNPVLTDGEISSLETVAWACWIDSDHTQEPRHAQLSSIEPKAYKNRESLVRRSDAEAVIALLQARIAELEAGSEPVKYEFQGRDGSWHQFIDERHYENTVADGSWPIRALYAAPQPTDRNAVIEECVSEILSKGESEIAPAAFFAHALRALKTNAK